MDMNPLRKDVIRSLEEGIRKARIALAFGSNMGENLDIIWINQKNIDLLKGEEDGTVRDRE